VGAGAVGACGEAGLVESAELLTIAGCHLDQLGSDLHLFATALLDCALTALAHRQGHLVGAPALVRRPLKHRARHQEQCRVVVERLARVAP
jgi:hypothetical protein